MRIQTKRESKQKQTESMRQPYAASMEVSATRGTTALVYCLINSSLYTGTVQGWWSTPQLVRRSVGV
jgi:hypothetical protein